MMPAVITVTQPNTAKPSKALGGETCKAPRKAKTALSSVIKASSQRMVNCVGG